MVLSKFLLRSLLELHFINRQKMASAKQLFVMADEAFMARLSKPSKILRATTQPADISRMCPFYLSTNNGQKP